MTFLANIAASATGEDIWVSVFFLFKNPIVTKIVTPIRHIIIILWGEESHYGDILAYKNFLIEFFVLN